MPRKFTVHLACYQRFTCSVEVTSETHHSACDAARKRLPASPSHWDEGPESRVFVDGVIKYDNDDRIGKYCRVPNEDRESRVLMHMLSEAVVGEDQKDGV